MSFLKLLDFIINHPLNKDDKINAILRFGKWQIASRLAPGAIAFDWVNGSKFLVRTGETGLTGNIYTGLHEFADMAFLLHVLRSDDLFVDVGANVGSYTILAGSAVGASCYAFEPIPQTYARMMENIRLNHLEARVKCFNVAVSREPGIVEFTNDMDTVNHALAENERYDKAIKVNVATLDQVLTDESPALIKIDVEGYETLVLEGAAEILKNKTLHSVILELNGSGKRYNFDESRILEMMGDYGFKTYSYNPFDRSLIDLKGKNMDSGNTLFIRDESTVLDRLNTSQRFVINGKSI